MVPTQFNKICTNVLPNPPPSPLTFLVFANVPVSFSRLRVYNITVRLLKKIDKVQKMTNNKEKRDKIECELRCKATAELNSQIVDELLAEDKSLSELLGKKEDEERETE